MTYFFTHNGLPILFAVVMIESFGIPLPGETALIAFGVLAVEGHYSIVWVIAIAAAGAIVGDNLGYWLIGRLGGRALFRRWGWLNKYSDRVLPHAESLMARHGVNRRPSARFASRNPRGDLVRLRRAADGAFMEPRGCNGWQSAAN